MSSKGHFLSSPVPLFQSESTCKCKTTYENETACKTRFYMKGFALSETPVWDLKRQLQSSLVPLFQNESNISDFGNWFSQAGNKTIRTELLYKKTFPLDGQTRPTKLSAQLLNLPGTEYK